MHILLPNKFTALELPEVTETHDVLRLSQKAWNFQTPFLGTEAPF